MKSSELINIGSKLLREKAADLGIDIEMLKRSLNVGFSGGEKKKMKFYKCLF